MALVFVLSSCGNGGGSAVTEPSNPDQPTSTLTSTASEASDVRSWPAGSATCADLESNVPAAVDDFGISLEDGLLVYRWTDEAGNNAEGTIQVYDDATCSVDTDAWQFLISPGLNIEQLDRNGSICSVIDALTGDNPPANSEKLLDYIGDRDALAFSCP
ncbi:MAG: hypothetical protein HKO10_10060 [Acidimicrobiia bacterium]|nr:hypothetical protein [Acidimicrobiia bacterium]